MRFGYFSTFQTFDKGLIEKIGPTGFSSSFSSFASNFVASSSGFLFVNIFLIIGFALVYCTLFFFSVFFFSLSFNFIFLFLAFFTVLLID
jgi:hypothetical protein